VRITFKQQFCNSLVPGESKPLVIRIQPDVEIIKCNNERLGWHQDSNAPKHLDMNSQHSFPGSYVPGAYERMLLNAASGDQSLFVGSEELVEAWRIFTPLLDEIDAKQPQPVCYPFGVEAPEGFDKFASKRGVACKDAGGRYCLPMVTHGLAELIPQGEEVWHADKTTLEAFKDRVGHNVGNNFVKCNVDARPGVPDPHCVQLQAGKYLGASEGMDQGNSMRSVIKTANAIRRWIVCIQAKPRNSDDWKATADVTPRSWRILKLRESISEFTADRFLWGFLCFLWGVLCFLWRFWRQ